MNLDELVKEAFHSYQIYLSLSGVLGDQSTKLSLLKWPDIAQMAVECISNPSNDKLDILHSDLCIAIIAPIENIYNSTVERLKQLTKQEPAGIKTVSDLIAQKKFIDPISLKVKVISELNKMFVTLQTLTGVEYPSLKERK